MCFKNNTCCCCNMPLWVGVLIIGLMEYGTGYEMMAVGLEWGGLYMFNSIWFALLFVPSLFYNPQYRKALITVYTITLILNILGAIGMEVNWAMLEEDQQKAAIADMRAAGAGAGMGGGDKAAYGFIINYLVDNGPMQAWNMTDEQKEDPVQWEEDRVNGAMMMMTVDMWVNMIFLRIFFTVVLKKFEQEGFWLKTANGEDTDASHPCRPTMCCSGCMGTKM